MIENVVLVFAGWMLPKHAALARHVPWNKPARPNTSFNRSGFSFFRVRETRMLFPADRRRVNSTVMWFISPREYWTLKQLVAWFIALVAVVGVVISYWGIYIMAAYFAAGLVWWASLSLFVSGPIGLGAFGLAWSKPRQPLAMTVGILAFLAWGFLWFLLLLAMSARTA